MPFSAAGIGVLTFVALERPNTHGSRRSMYHYLFNLIITPLHAFFTCFIFYFLLYHRFISTISFSLP